MKIILTDLDGVLRNYPHQHSRVAEKQIGLPEGSLLPTAFQQRFLEPAITGAISDEQWRELIIGELSLRFERSVVEDAVGLWSAFPGELDHEVHSLYLAKKTFCKIALLTNATSKLNADLRALGIHDLFDVIYNTSETDFAKPDARVYEHVLATIGCPANEIFFVDDREENIAVARSLGFKTHLFRGVAGLERNL